MKTTCALIGLIFLASCGVKVEESKKTHSSSPIITEYFVQGNPLQLIEGTQANTTSFLTTDNYLEFNSAQLSTMKLFYNKAKINKDNTPGVIEGSPRGVVEDGFSLAMTWEKSKKYHILKNGEFKLLFSTNKDNQLILEEVRYQTMFAKLNILHYSVSPDKRYFSFLGSAIQDDFNFLLSLTFYVTTKTDEEIKRVHAEVRDRPLNESFNYLEGRGVQIPWPSIKKENKHIIDVDVCPTMNEQFEFNLTQKSLKRWDNESIQIQVNKKEKCLPFSDVNEHGIHLVKSYITTNPKSKTTNPAVTIVDYVSGTYIMDADIFVYDKEIKKTLGPYILGKARLINVTLMHELGHFLGLGHKFEDKQSIMSYEETDEIGQTDHDAIKNLYP